MKRFIAVVAVMVAMCIFTTQESSAQFYRGGSGISIGYSSGGFGGYGGGFNRGYSGGGFNTFNRGFGGSGFNSFNRGFGGGGYSRSYSSYRPSYGRSYGGGGFYGGGRSCGY